MNDFKEYVKIVKDSIDVRDLFAHLNVEVNRHNMTNCIAPDHKDKKPSMWSGQYGCGCYSCGFHADCFAILQTLKGISFKEALNYCADYAGIPKFEFEKKSQQELKLYETQRKKEKQLYKILDDAVKIYESIGDTYLCEKRGISPDIIQQFHIGSTNGSKTFLKDELCKKGHTPELFAPLLLNSYGQDFFQACTIIPIWKYGKCIGLYGRKNDGSAEFKHLYLKRDGFTELGIEPETVLFNLDAVHQSKEIYIFESIIDCLSAISNGILKSTGIYGTQGFKEEHLKQLKATNVEEIYLVMDGDEPGRKAAIKNGYKIEDAKVNVNLILMPEGQDPNEYFSQGGTKETFEKLPRMTPLQLAIEMTDPSIKGQKFLKAIEPILERIARQDPLVWRDDLQKIREHFHTKPAIGKLEEKVKSLAKLNEIQAVVAKEIEKIKNPLSKIFTDESLQSMSIPYNWMLTEDGIFQVKERPQGDSLLLPVAHYPIIITETAKDIDDEREFLTLKYKKKGKIFNLHTDRKTISELKSITQLAEKGFPVTSANAKSIIQYLDDFEAENIEHLKKSYITHCFGHNYDSKGNLIFYLPQKVYNTDENITFVGSGPGDYDFYHALTPQGKLEDWINIIKKYCLSHDLVMFNLYAGFAVPLLKYFNIQKSFTIDFYGRSSTGKTTANEVVASIFGNPTKLILQWDHITQVAAEQLASLFNGIPIFLDDSQNADPKKIQSFIYMIANSVGKARGHLSGGLRKVLYWLTILFNTGERMVIEHIKDEGASARNWGFGRSPFDSENEKEMADKIRQLKKAIYKTYGVAIGPFMDYIHSAGMEKLTHYYEDAYSAMSNQITGGGKTHRQIEYWAAILAAGLLVEEVFKFGKSPIYVCQNVLALFQEEGVTDSISDAMDDYISWANANDNRYDISGVPNEDHDKSYGERHGVKNPGEYIAVFPHLLRDFLVREGYSYKTILKGWKDRGWIETRKGKMTYNVSYKGKNAAMVKIIWKIYNNQ